MRHTGTNTVQAFIRSVGFIFTFLLLSLLFILPLSVSGAIEVVIIPVLAFNLWAASVVSKMFYILPEWERMVLLRLGKFEGVKGPGFFVIPPFVYSVAALVDTRIETHQVEATATLTRDNVPTKVMAAIEFVVEDPRKAIIDVQNYRQSVTWLSTEALKNTIGSMDLKGILSEREEIADSLKVQIDEAAKIYGVDVRAVRLTDIDTPASLVEELAVIARARRSAEAKQIQANAEVLVAEKTAEASQILSGAQNAVKLRELQLLSEMSKEESSMIIIYPYGEREGQEIAHSVAGRINEKSKPIDKELVEQTKWPK